LVLQRAGLSFALIDARRTIGTPLRCGELTREVLFNVLEIDPPAGAIRWRLTERGSAVVVNRPALESALAQQLADGGAMVRTGAAVTHVGPYRDGGRTATIADEQGRNHTVTARCVVAADGIASRTARYGGVDTFVPPSKLAACLAYRLAGAEIAEPGRAVLAYFPKQWPSYFWVIPSGPHEANVGLSLPAEKGLLLRSTWQLSVARSRLVRGGRPVETIVGLYSLTPPLDRPFADGLLIAGGAARMVDPRNGEGIMAAAMSGKAAGQTLVELGGAEPVAARLAEYRDRAAPVYEILAEAHRERA
jgi:digeranylgeranylglycerophospholipid reductase